jgi:hypothetical protein
MARGGERKLTSTEPGTAFHVIALDTGLVTGVCAITIATAPYITTDSGIAVSHTASERSWLQAVAYAERWARAGDEHSTVSLCWERYDNPPGRRILTAQPEAQKANGALEYVATQCGVTFRQQSRVDAKKVVTDKVLRQLGWFKSTKDGHANDASRQAGFFLHQNHPELWMKLLGK